jgi:hypothetical protein
MRNLIPLVAACWLIAGCTSSLPTEVYRSAKSYTVSAYGNEGRLQWQCETWGGVTRIFKENPEVGTGSSWVYYFYDKRRRCHIASGEHIVVRPNLK